MDKAKLSGDTANVRVFKDKLLNLIAMMKELKQQGAPFDTKLFVTNIRHINDLLIDVRTEKVDNIRATDLLEGTRASDVPDEERFEIAVEQLKVKTEAIEQLLAEFYIMRLKILGREMFEKRKQIEQMEAECQEKQEEIDQLRSELETKQSLWRRAFKKQQSTEESKAIQARLTKLIHETQEAEALISEQDLTDWLDAIVDASLNPFSQTRIDHPVRDARICLYYLLNKFCILQEASALQIAQNPFIQVDPEKAIKYMLLSEEFILDYFAKKKNDQTAWLSGAAQVKIEDLEKLQKDLLGELRRSLKVTKKLH